jgi:hypothetical protein
LLLLLQNTELHKYAALFSTPHNAQSYLVARGVLIENPEQIVTNFNGGVINTDNYIADFDATASIPP